MQFNKTTVIALIAKYAARLQRPLVAQSFEIKNYKHGDKHLRNIFIAYCLSTFCMSFRADAQMTLPSLIVKE